MWICILLCECSEDTFENPQWRKVKQMQPMWLCIHICKRFVGTFENTQWRKIKQMQPVWLCILLLALWGLIWKYTVEKNQTNAANVTLPLLGQSIWGDIWKRKVEKSKQKKLVWFCLFWSKLFEYVFKTSQELRMLSPSLCIQRSQCNCSYCCSQLSEM